MKTINLLRPQHFKISEGERILVGKMLDEAYRVGITVGMNQPLGAADREKMRRHNKLLRTKK